MPARPRAGMAFCITGKPERSPPIPKMGIRKTKSRIRGKFSKPKRRPSTHHNSPRFHHKLTIKKPHSITVFRKIPAKNTKPLNKKNTLRETSASASPNRSNSSRSSCLVCTRRRRSRQIVELVAVGRSARLKPVIPFELIGKVFRVVRIMFLPPVRITAHRMKRHRVYCERGSLVEVHVLHKSIGIEEIITYPMRW